jgi:hypothetical protein
MGEAQKDRPQNRCIGDNCHADSPDKQREEQIKRAFVVSARMRKDSNKLLCLLRERYGCSLAGLLKVVERQVNRGELSLCVFEVLLEKLGAQRERYGLSPQEIADLETAKASPVRKRK